MIFGRSSAPVLLYVLHSGNLYGTERMALATLEGLTEYATRVVLAPRPSETASVTEAARASGYKTVVFDTRWQLLRGLLPWFLRRRAIDIIGVGVGSSMLCHALGRVLRVRLRQLHVAHGGTEDAWSYGNKRPLNAIPVVIVAVSDFVRQKLVQHGVRADSISVIDNFLSSAQRREYRRREPYATATATTTRSSPQARVRVAIVSRVDRIKKIDLLIRAVEVHGLSEFQFDIYGTGTELETLGRRSTALTNVCFHGYVGDVKKRLAEADLLLHLCPEEPFGLVILEAFQTGVVVAVPDAGGAGSLVDDGVTGLRFAPDSPEAVSEVLNRFRVMLAQEKQAMADAGSAALEQRFSQSEGVRRYRQALVDSAARAERTD